MNEIDSSWLGMCLWRTLSSLRPMPIAMHATSSATTPARPLCTREELPHELHEPRRLVLRDERAAVLHELEAAVGEELGELSPVLDGEELVAGGPGDEGGPVESRDAAGGRLHVVLARRSQHPLEIGAHAGVGADAGRV